MQFSELGLSQTVLDALAAKGYQQATPIQAQAIPPVLEGRDLLGIAQTGTGKTAAFMLPSIDRLVASKKRAQSRGCRMLVLAPTRELAAQIAESARHYSAGTKLSVATVFGGTSIYRNRQDLARGVDILVATPGRLVDLLDGCYAVLLGIEILVLDEADQMLDLGFIHALRRIVRELPAKRQTLFFSATMPKAIRELAGQFIHDPVEVKVTPVATTAERVDQYVTFVGQKEKQALLTMALDDSTIDRALVFTRTKHGADRVVRMLAGNGIASNAIHGNKSQPQRERALGDFRSGRVKILVATDIAARGIDVSGVSHVFNFELPNVPEQYVHRIGRTARAGNDGVAVSFCADDERAYLRDIERLTRQKLSVQPLPEDFVARAHALDASRVAVRPTHDESNGRRGREMQRDGRRPAQPRRREDGDRAQARPFDGERRAPRAQARPFDGERRPQRAGDGERANARPFAGERRPPRAAEGERAHARPFDGERRPQRASDGERPARPGQPRPQRANAPQRHGHAERTGEASRGPRGDSRPAPRGDAPQGQRGPQRRFDGKPGGNGNGQRRSGPRGPQSGAGKN